MQVSEEFVQSCEELWSLIGNRDLKGEIVLSFATKQTMEKVVVFMNHMSEDPPSKITRPLSFDQFDHLVSERYD